MSSFLRMESVSDPSLEWRNDKKPRNGREAKNRSDNEMQNRTQSHTSKEPKNFNSSLQLCLQKIILIRSQYDKKLKFLGSNRKLKGFRFFVGSFLRSFFALVFCGSFKAVSFGMGDKKPR